VQLEEHARLREQVCARLGQLCEHVTAGAIGGSTEQESPVQRPLQCATEPPRRQVTVCTHNSVHSVHSLLLAHGEARAGMGMYRSVLTQTDFEVDFSFAAPAATESVSVREHSRTHSLTSCPVGCALSKPVSRPIQRCAVIARRKSGDSHALCFGGATPTGLCTALHCHTGRPTG
jgi:hypothetical protein